MDTTVNKDVGLKIFDARKNLKMTRAELGKKVGLHESTVKRYEDGQIKSLDIEKMKEFAQALNTTPLDLLGWHYYDLKYPNIKKELEKYEKNTNSLEEQTLLDDFNKLNDLGKRKVITYTKDLTEMPKYQNNAVDTIAAHNDYINNNDELSKINEDIEDMKNW